MNKTYNKKNIRKNNRKTKKPKKQKFSKKKIVHGGVIENDKVLKTIYYFIKNADISRDEKKWPLKELFYAIRIRLLKELQKDLCKVSIFKRSVDNTMLCNETHITLMRWDTERKSSTFPLIYKKLLVNTTILKKLFRICLFLCSTESEHKYIGEFILNTFFKHSDVPIMIESLQKVQEHFDETFIVYLSENINNILNKKFTYDEHYQPLLLVVDDALTTNPVNNDDIGNDDIGNDDILNSDYKPQIPEKSLSIMEVNFLLDNNLTTSGGGDHADTRDYVKNFFQTIIDYIAKLPQGGTKKMAIGGLVVLFIVILLIYLCYLFYKSRKKKHKTSSKSKSSDKKNTLTLVNSNIDDDDDDDVLSIEEMQALANLSTERLGLENKIPV